MEGPYTINETPFGTLVKKKTKRRKRFGNKTIKIISDPDFSEDPK